MLKVRSVSTTTASPQTTKRSTATLMVWPTGRSFCTDRCSPGWTSKGGSVLEALSGSGHATDYLLTQKKALVTGLDISEEAIASFKARWPACQAICAPITTSGLADESFDCIVVVMGLHHLHPHLNDAVHEIHRLLRKGGIFCFAEPHKESAFSRLRAIWYRHDSLFADNEEALDIEDLKREFTESLRIQTGAARRRRGVSAGSKLNDLSRAAVVEKNLFAGGYAFGKNAGRLSFAGFFAGSNLPVGKEMKQ